MQRNKTAKSTDTLFSLCLDIDVRANASTNLFEDV